MSESAKDWTFYKSVPCTLDEVVLGVWIPGKDADGEERLGNTFRNGCSFSLVVDPAYPCTDPRYMKIGWGCFGVMVHLAQGHRRQLMQWLEAQIGDRSSEMVPLPITPETQVELLKLKPCERCGSPLFQVKRPDPRYNTDPSQSFDPRDVDFSNPLPLRGGGYGE